MISEVHNCNCLEYMKSLPDKFFDLCIADPPFGINIHKSGRLKNTTNNGLMMKYQQKRCLMKCSDVAKTL